MIPWEGAQNSGGSLNCELRGQFENFSSASGRDLATLIGGPPRVARPDDREILDVLGCGNSLSCKMIGHFGNFASASGRDMPGLTGISLWKGLSEGGEWLDESPSLRRVVSG